MPRERTRVELPYLRSWRIAKLLSQDELADRAHVMKSTIVRLEREPDASGARQAAILSTIGKLAKGLGITRQQLVYEDPEHPTKHVSGAA
jgi:DNA-binding XRE family transcriptional regulator